MSAAGQPLRRQTVIGIGASAVVRGVDLESRATDRAGGWAIRSSGGYNAGRPGGQFVAGVRS